MTDQQVEQLAGHISPDPLDIHQKYSLQTYLGLHRAEDAYLINPYFDNPATYFGYEADDVLEEVKIIPAAPQFAPHVKAAEDFYGLNRIELRNFRYLIFAKFRAFKLSYRVLTDAFVKKEIEKQLKSMLSDKYLFAGMNRYFDTIL